jgi:hypothetical protein
MQASPVMECSIVPLCFLIGNYSRPIFSHEFHE